MSFTDFKDFYFFLLGIFGMWVIQIFDLAYDNLILVSTISLYRTINDIYTVIRNILYFYNALHLRNWKK